MHILAVLGVFTFSNYIVVTLISASLGSIPMVLCVFLLLQSVHLNNKVLIVIMAAGSKKMPRGEGRAAKD